MLETLFAPLTIIVSRKEIETIDTSHVLKTLKTLLVSREKIKSNCENIEISVFGYDNDERELWEIPEVNHFFNVLDNLFPYWFYFLIKNGTGLKMITFCCTNTQKISDTKTFIEPASFKYFLNKHLLAMNKLGDIIGMSDQENIELTKRIVDYYS